jgi:PHD/YefM family antitoxin component YafN of YafNO toxin-antitoxin module
MPALRVAASEFQKAFGRYSVLAKRQPLTVTTHGRDELVVLDVAEFERLKRLDTSVIMSVDAMTEADFRRLEAASPIAEDCRKLDHLVPDNW